jgi:ribonuclease-3
MSNERLEYLGDAVLSSIIADYLFKKFPYKDEGFLTEMRARIVSRSQLNRLSKKLGLDKLIQSGLSLNQGKSLHGNAFEAFVGALYLDKGYKYARKIVIKRVIDIHLDIEKIENEDHNYKSQLIEWSQKQKKPLEFRLAEEIGNGFSKQYLVEVKINEKVYSTGRDYSIKGAEQLAAEKALEIIDEEESGS